MSKVSNAINMLILLNSRGKMKIRELADLLEVDERSIRTYRDELEKASIFIESTKGKYGGYKLLSKEYLLDLDLNEKEYKILFMAKECLKKNNFVFNKEYELILDKIKVAKKEYEKSDIEIPYFIKGNTLNYDFMKEKNLCINLNAAIVSKNKIKIKYINANNIVKERVIRPYEIFQYEGGIYILAYCEYRNEIRQFKLSRIEDYKILKEKFDEDKEFDYKKYMINRFGIFSDEEMEIKIKIKYPIAKAVQERKWVENQIIEKVNEKDNSYIIFKAKVKGITEVRSWILSMGSSAYVIEPKELREWIKEEIENIQNLYK